MQQGAQRLSSPCLRNATPLHALPGDLEPSLPFLPLEERETRAPLLPVDAPTPQTCTAETSKPQRLLYPTPFLCNAAPRSGLLARCAGGTGAGDSTHTPTLPSPSSGCSAHAATTSAGPRLHPRLRFPRPQQQTAASPPPCAARLTSPSAYFTPQPQNNGIRAFPSRPLQAERSTEIAAVALETAPNLFRGRPRSASPAPLGLGAPYGAWGECRGRETISSGLRIKSLPLITFNGKRTIGVFIYANRYLFMQKAYCFFVWEGGIKNPFCLNGGKKCDCNCYYL